MKRLKIDVRIDKTIKRCTDCYYYEDAEDNLSWSKCLYPNTGIDILRDPNTTIDKKCPLIEVAPEVESDSYKYHQLLNAVESKYPGETRHETALKYIEERENKKLTGATSV